MAALKRIFKHLTAPVLGVIILIAGIAVWSVIASIPLSIFALLQRLVEWTSSHPWRQAICSLILALIGFALYQLRARNQLLYGAFEIIVALAGFWYALGTTTNLQASAAAIIASLYVFVRGVDNYKAGITEQHRRMGLDDQHQPLSAPTTSDK
jgi:uncharacterized membrane protein